MPYLRITQAAYTNISIYDRIYCEEMFGGFIYPDGEMFIDHIEPFIEFQKSFLLKLQEMRETNVFTYPVMTYNLVYREGKFLDENFARWLSNHNRKYADANFLISPETTSAASCCFDGDVEGFLCFDNFIYEDSFEALYKRFKGKRVKVRLYGQWSPATLIAIKRDTKTKMLLIKTEENRKVIVTDNHIFPVGFGEKRADEIIVGEKLVLGTHDGETKFDTVVSVEPYSRSSEYVYCFQVEEGYPPYFTLSNGIISHNCRLVSNFSDLQGVVLNSIGGSSLDIGSVVVTTLNLAGYAEQAVDEDDFFRILRDKTQTVVKINDVVRGIIQRNVEKGLLPNYSSGLMKMNRQMNTLGISGLAEAAKRFGYLVQDELGYWDYTEAGIDFGSRVLNKINEIKDSCNFDYSINIEQTPMENGAIKLAHANSLLYGTKEYILANQWIPLKDKATIQARTRAAGIFDRKCGGGAITHIQIDAPIETEEMAWKLLNFIAQQGVIYFAFNLKINVDKENHTFTTKTCPICGASPVETFQRCVGYLVPTHSWSEGRKRELSERQWMTLDSDVIL